MFRVLLLAAWAPALVSCLSIESTYDEAVSALSQDLVNSTADLSPFRHNWTQRVYLVFKEECYFQCSQGVAGPLSGIQRPPDMPVLQNNGYLVSSVQSPDIRYYYSWCTIQLVFEGTEHYAGFVEDVSLDLSFSLSNSTDGCVATVSSLEVGTYKTISYDDDNWGVKLADNFSDLKLVTELLSDKIVEGLNSHFTNFVNRNYTISHQCAS